MVLPPLSLTSCELVRHQANNVLSVLVYLWNIANDTMILVNLSYMLVMTTVHIIVAHIIEGAFEIYVCRTCCNLFPQEVHFFKDLLFVKNNVLADRQSVKSSRNLKKSLLTCCNPITLESKINGRKSKYMYECKRCLWAGYVHVDNQYLRPFKINK